MKKKYLSPETKVVPIKVSPLMLNQTSGYPQSFEFNPDDDSDDDDYDPNASRRGYEWD